MPAPGWRSQRPGFRSAGCRPGRCRGVTDPASRLGICEDAPIEILNLKCEPILTGSLTDGCHIFPAYHMNKTHWISVRIDNGLQEDKLFFLIDMSYRLTGSKSRKKKAESV